MHYSQGVLSQGQPGEGQKNQGNKLFFHEREGGKINSATGKKGAGKAPFPCAGYKIIIS